MVVVRVRLGLRLFLNLMPVLVVREVRMHGACGLLLVVIRVVVSRQAAIGHELSFPNGTLRDDDVLAHCLGAADRLRPERGEHFAENIVQSGGRLHEGVGASGMLGGPGDFDSLAEILGVRHGRLWRIYIPFQNLAHSLLCDTLLILFTHVCVSLRLQVRTQVYVHVLSGLALPYHLPQVADDDRV